MDDAPERVRAEAVGREAGRSDGFEQGGPGFSHVDFPAAAGTIKTAEKKRAQGKEYKKERKRMKQYDYEKLAARLRARGFLPHIAETKEELKRQVLDLAGTGSVGFGGSVGVESLNVYEVLKERGNEVYWHWKSGDKQEAHRKALDADLYLCSVNALTADGEIVEIEGTGNRLGALLFGPEKVAVVAGENKLAEDVETGIAQIKKNVCPGNARRLGHKTPCTQTGECAGCISAESMCRVTAVISQPPRHTKEFHVFLLKEPLGR